MNRPLAEVRVFSRKYHFAGTADVLGLWRGVGAICDYKTGSPSDVATDLQTAAYLAALSEMLQNGDEPEHVVFDEAQHVYTLEGKRLPSVTGVLQAAGLIDLSKIPDWKLEPARQRGTAVHQACHYYNEGDLDVAAFCEQFDGRDEAHPNYAPYLMAWLRFREESTFKLATSFAEIGELGHVKRYAVQLKRTGFYKVEPYTASRDIRDFLTLLAAQTIKAARRGTWDELCREAA